MLFFVLQKLLIEWPISSYSQCDYIDGLVQGCFVSTINALELLQSCSKQSTCILFRK